MSTPSAEVDDPTPRGTIHVLGYVGGGPGPPMLPPGADSLLAAADVVVGGRRHLDALAVPDSRRVVLGQLAPALDALAALPAGALGVVVASGDPGFFGIVRRLRAAGLRCVVHPVPSAVALAFGRLGLPWEDAQVVSAHGRDLRRALNVARAHTPTAVMTGVDAGIRQLAAGLEGHEPPRELVLAERLGEDDERVRRLTPTQALALRPDDIREPNVVLVLGHSTSFGGAAEHTHGAIGTPPWRLTEPRDPDGHPAAPGRELVAADDFGSLVAGALDARPGDLVVAAGAWAGPVVDAVRIRGAAVRPAPTTLRPPPTPAAAAAGVPTTAEPDGIYLGLVAAEGPGGPDEPKALRALVAAAVDHVHAPRALAVLVDGLDAARALSTAIPDRDWRMLTPPAAVVLHAAPRAGLSAGRPDDAGDAAPDAPRAPAPPPRDPRLLLSGPRIDPGPPPPTTKEDRPR